ncbi:Fur family transcriptional regulator [Solirubrobacter deserti]|uniref:Transcriptional repressor n=1 Tax=Solirubrobacter deserti TaxID=2282478 RepID=A0ABT4RK91_9ACTN|nr:transcriptional repressor [Solirubrobacter deserti]MDA0138954.1 transcriptional repressor [Solirubrobacter deserti]
MTEAALVNTVRAHGLRVSALRRTVLRRLLAADAPLTAEELARGEDVASTYRNLNALETIGVVRHIHLGHGPGRYTLSGRSAGWVTCERCGRSTPIADDALHRLREAVLAVTGYQAGFNRFPIVGRCVDCI